MAPSAAGVRPPEAKGEPQDVATPIIVRLLNEILEQQRAQLHVQREQLHELRKNPQHESDLDESVFDKLGLASRAGTRLSPWKGVETTLVDLGGSSLSLQGNTKTVKAEAESSEQHGLRLANHVVENLMKRAVSGLTPSSVLSSELHPQNTGQQLREKGEHPWPEGLQEEPLIKWQLILAGVLPHHMFHRTFAYRVYQAILVIAEILHCAKLILENVPDPESVQTRDDEVLTASIVMLVIQVCLIHPLWHAWISEFGDRGPTLKLFNSMDQHRFCWPRLRTSIRISHGVSALMVLSAVVLYVVQNSKTFTTEHSLEHEHSRILGRVYLAIDVCGFCSRLLWLFVGTIHIWSVYFVVCMLRHDLLCYASALARAFEADDTDEDVLVALKKLADLTTSRLKWASDRWVRYVLLYIAGLGTITLLMCLFLLKTDLTSEGFSLYTFFAFFGFLLILALGFPLAKIAEVYESEVIPALNNPYVLNKAQKHIGQQLLSHLTNLNWGFRVCGTTIKANSVGGGAIAVIVALIITVSQAALKSAGAS